MTDESDEWIDIVSETLTPASSSSTIEDEKRVVVYEHEQPIRLNLNLTSITDPSIFISRRELLGQLFFREEGANNPFAVFYEFLKKTIHGSTQFLCSKAKKDNSTQTTIIDDIHDYDIHIHNTFARLLLPSDETYSRINHGRASLILKTAIYCLTTSLTDEQVCNFRNLFHASDDKNILCTIIESYNIKRDLVQWNAIKCFKIADILDLILFEYTCMRTFGPLIDYRRLCHVGEEYGGQTGYPCLDSLIEVGFHNLRALRDTAFDDCLYVCLLSTEYLNQILRPHISTEVDESPKKNWFKIAVYFPFNHSKTEAGMRYFFPILMSFFLDLFPEKYRHQTILEICLPETTIGMKTEMKILFPNTEIFNYSDAVQMTSQKTSSSSSSSYEIEHTIKRIRN
jgi:hypothetical protein